MSTPFLIPPRIRALSKLDGLYHKPKSIHVRLNKLFEEVGELSAAVLRVEGYKESNGIQKDLDNLELEAVDVLIMAFDILSHLEMSDEKINKILTSQLDKWQRNHDRATAKHHKALEAWSKRLETGNFKRAIGRAKYLKPK